MKTISKLTCILLATVFLMSSCASIVSKSKYPVSFNSDPQGSTITITNKKGIEVFNGKTPSSVILKSGAGFFSKERYTVKYEMDGYEAKIVTLDCKLDGWYFGNLLFGGFIGILIVDPATGAMFKLDRSHVSTVLKQDITQNENERALKIMSINDIPESERENLVKLN